MTKSRCSNCEAPLEGPYCAQCGQRERGRLTVRELVGNLVDSLFSIDSTLWRTVVGLARNPGALCRDYVSGRRARYLSPLRYCIAALALYLLVSVLLGADPTRAVGTLEIGGSERADQAREGVTGNIDLVLFLSLPLLAAMLRLYYWRAGHNFAEVAAYALYMLGQMFVLSIPLIPVSLLSPPIATGLRLALQVILFTWSAKIFFGGRGVLGWVKALGVQVLYIASILPVALLVIVYFYFTSG